MSHIPHRAFIRQPDGVTVVSNGAITATFDTLAQFAAAQPDFAMPAGVVGINYEHRGNVILHARTMENGATVFPNSLDEDLESIIDGVNLLAAARQTMSHPLWGVTNINQARTITIQQIDMLAEQVRLQYITAGSGQAMVYQQKQQEAARWLASGQPADLTGYPLIAAEVGITAATAADLVNLWVTMQTQWAQIAAAIETVRLGAKNAVNNAADIPSIKAVLDSLDWPSL